jgi:predicted ATPase
MDKHLNYFEVRWENFKGFKDTNWVKIKPITILLGENNSGKSNFTAPLLLMQQTLTSKDPNSPLIIKSSLYDGGNIKEILTNYNLNKDFKFGIRYHIHYSDEKKLPALGDHAPGSFEVTFGIKGHEKDGDIIVKEEIISDVFKREFLTLKRLDSGRYKLLGPFSSRKMASDERLAIKKSSPINFIFTTDSLLRELAKLKRPNKEKSSGSKKKGYTNAFSDLLEVLAYNYSSIYTYIGYLSYIGPMREQPHRIYEVSNESYNTVGPKGENMTTLIKKHFSKRNSDLDHWVQKFGFGDWLELEPLYGNTYSIRFREERNSKYYTSIANSGFGASQILPLIIQALVADEDDLTIAEQPEIHLNPKLQCELADLFVFMAKRRQKIIVETHSEYMLLRLRKLVAEKAISSDDIAVYFISKEKGYSNIKEIPIQKDGHIKTEDWPKDFFEDSLRESLALANEQYKSNKSSQK